MLVLTRRVNEKILLPDLQIAIQVVAVKPNQVRLGIDAPADVQIFREELLPAGTGRMAAVSDDKPALPHNRLVHAHLDACSTGLDQFRRQLALGRREVLSATLERIEAELRELHRELVQPTVV